jgi:hypothetical protein
MYMRWIQLVAVTLVTTGVASAQVETATKADPSGSWKWERDFNGNKIGYTLRLIWKDSKLDGTYQTVMENGPAELRTPVKIADGKWDGDKISFTVTRSFNGNEFTLAYAGKLADDKIAGDAKMDFGDGPRTFDWNAQRVVTADDVAGKWNLKFEGPNGAIEPVLTLTKDQEGDKLKGIYHSTYFGDNPIKDVALKDNKLTFVVEIRNDNGEFKISYTAEPRGDKLTGVIVANFGGQQRETPFQGTRAEEPPRDVKQAGNGTASDAAGAQ